MLTVVAAFWLEVAPVPTVFVLVVLHDVRSQFFELPFVRVKVQFRIQLFKGISIAVAEEQLFRVTTFEQLFILINFQIPRSLVPYYPLKCQRCLLATIIVSVAVKLQYYK
jgi:hypothetical protein